jgi:phosphoribosyl-ATP pyrophosphohydrolase/phosphoribosyl-AMP cyclohydrolase
MAEPVEVALDERGLVVAIAQDRLTGQVRMVAWMSREALSRTLATGLATFYSRSRGALWQKGETSGNTLRVSEVWADCDADAVLLLVEPEGPSCHTGRPACFFRRIEADGSIVDVTTEAEPFLEQLQGVLRARRASSGERSYTRSLYDGGAHKIGDKLREEADELAHALAEESDDRVTSEAADLVYHALVGLAFRGLSLRDVVAALCARSGIGGHEEKARRGG